MKKRSKKEKIVDPREIEKDDIITEIDDSPDDLKELKELIGEGEYKVAVYKLSSDGTQWEKVGSYPLDQFMPDEIAKSYGGGKFKFRVVDSEGKFVRQMTVPYAVIKQEPKDTKKDEILDFIKSELSSRDLLLSKLIENMKPIQNNNLTELITALSTLKNMEKSQPPVNFNDMLNILKMGFNMTKELQENLVSEPESVEKKFIDTMIEKLLPNLLNTLSGGANHTLKKIPPYPPLIQKNGSETKPMQQSIQQSIQQPVNYVSPFEKTLVENFRMYEKPLLAQSVNKENIPNVCNIILQMLSDDDVLQLEKYLKEYSYHRILNFIPSLAPARDWLKLLVDELLRTISSIVEPDDTEVENDEIEKLENLEKLETVLDNQNDVHEE